MTEPRCKALIVDCDEDVLVALQHMLEGAGIDTTITWDHTEARTLLGNQPFDILLVGDHPSVETILRDFSVDLTSCPCFLLQASPVVSEQMGRLGISGVAPKRDPLRVLEQVQKYWQARRTNTVPTIAGPGNPSATTRLLESHVRAA